ncbi:DNA-nicking Smr family endonuclease [Sphingomonas vulcanisoli]|uniref:DNA-nicking Smr family endonuclease n=1 Tax=Sphingomonas vulcanisoli TaxID=1658060 RepID=A0ABX0TV29_9SPHN|nr:Smr/MutS family protein [Sphingomonas vulcanisoli]NIJ08205.1 DNA-nicking Smr family endonuclease [Sphingomonas vulcanisoli]
MAGRRLSAEEQELWARVAATVHAYRPLPGIDPLPPAPARPKPPAIRPSAPPLPAKAAAPGDTLDGGWDRRLRQGAVAPDRTIDLHGHTLASAHTALTHALERAIADDARLLLVVTGRARPADATPRRGLIRAAIGDWLAASPYAGRIAAIRNAHPRHGGGGALYIVLRRRR